MTSVMLARLATSLGAAALACVGTGTPAQPANVGTLTSARPALTVPIGPAAAVMRQPILELPVVRVRNPQVIPLTVTVHLERDVEGASAGLSSRIGSFAFYPPDRAGSHLLDSRRALRVMEPKGLTSTDRVRLRLEIHPVERGRALADIEIEIGPLQWRAPNELKLP